jgi:hypothetical protein
MMRSRGGIMVLINQGAGAVLETPSRVAARRRRSLAMPSVARPIPLPPVGSEARERVERRVLGKTTRLDNGCLRWDAAKDRRGYGRVGIGQRMYFAHRVVYALLRGEPPAGAEPDHTCRFASCVEPDHLDWVPHRENVRRGASPFAVAGRSGVCLRGHPLTAENTIVKRTTGRRQCRQCANEAARRRRQMGSRDEQSA